MDYFFCGSKELQKDEICRNPLCEPGHLIGGIDLLGGLAVHSKANDGRRYDLVRLTDKEPGDAFTLLQWYRDHGLKQFFVSDIDSFLRHPRQCKLIEKFCLRLAADESLWIDCRVIPNELKPGRTSCRIDFVQRLLHSGKFHPAIKLVLADSSRYRPSDFSSVGNSIDPGRLAMGVRLRDQVSRKNGCREKQVCVESQANAMEKPLSEAWFAQGHQAGIRSGFLVNNASMGVRGDSKTLEVCRAWSQQYRDWKWACGGGIPVAKAHDKIHGSGCAGVLVATTEMSDGQVVIV